MIYAIKRDKKAPFVCNHINLGGDNGRDKIEVSNKYILKNGKAWIPCMGEYHFSRANPSEWKRELYKMKAGGISVVSSYVIWIHHEEEEGELNFSGSRNIREFAKTCFECGLYLILRIGPWVHGEVKNGGFPDWLVNKNIKLRSNDPEYLMYCEKWYNVLAQQLDKLMYKDGTGLIGFQIENELVRDKEHMKALLEAAKRAGLDAPLYTATAWGIPTDAELPEKDFLPVFGAYSERPWAGHTNKLEPNKHYFFGNMRNDHTIGADLIVKEDAKEPSLNYDLYPFATCELGGGVQVTYQRRPVISGREIAAITCVKLGSGANLIGYYMYHGGRNPVGKTTTMQETKKSGYPNDLPAIDYDFQAQLGAWGLPNEQYGLCRITALFIHDFGDILAKCEPYFPENKISSVYDDKTLRYSMRLNGNSGFVFINNYSREMQLSEHEDVRFKVGEEVFPKKGLNIKDRDFGILPVNITLGSIKLKYSAMQLICKCDDAYFFFSPFGSDETYIENAKAIDGGCTCEGGMIYDISGTVKITSASGETIKIVKLNHNEAQNLSIHFNKAYISECNLFSDFENVYAWGTDEGGVKVFDGESFKKIIFKVTSHEEELQLTELDENSFESKYTEEFTLGCGSYRLWEIKLPEARENLMLSLDISGDIAQLYADGKFVADSFLCGRKWYVGPDEFLNCKKLVLAASGLSPDGKYLECEKKQGLKINKIMAKYMFVKKIGKGEDAL